MFAGGDGRKNDDTDAHAIAMVAVHTPDLPEVGADDRSVALRLVSHRRKELIGMRSNPRPLCETGSRFVHAGGDDESGKKAQCRDGHDGRP